MILGTISINIVVAIINIVTSILAARVLGADGRGELALILLYPQAIATMGLLGVDRGLSLLSGSKEIMPSLKFVIFLSALITIPVVVIIFYVVQSQISNNSLIELSLIYTAYVPALYVFMYSSAIFNGVGMFKQFNVSKFSFYISYLLVILIFLQILDDFIMVFLYSNLLSSYIAAIISLIFLVKKEGGKNTKVSFYKNIILIFHKSKVYLIPGLLIILTTKVDLMVISDNLDVKYLGIFVVYLAYAHLLGPIEVAVNTHVLHHGINNSIESAIFTIRVTAFILIVGSILLALLAPFAIGLLYGSEYLQEIAVAQILAISAFFYFVSKNVNEYMIGKLLVRQDSISSLIFIVIFIFVSYALMPWYQFSGIAIAMLLANIARFLYIVITFNNRMQVRFSDFLIVDKNDMIRVFSSTRWFK